VVRRLVETVDVLEEFPRSGRRVPEHPDREDLREFVRPPFRIVYLLTGDVTHVVTIFHSSRADSGNPVSALDSSALPCIRRRMPGRWAVARRLAPIDCREPLEGSKVLGVGGDQGEPSGESDRCDLAVDKRGGLAGLLEPGPLATVPISRDLVVG
jgi:hypothetical protein